MYYNSASNSWEDLKYLWPLKISERTPFCGIHSMPSRASPFSKRVVGFTQCHPGHPPFRKGVDESAALLRHYLGNDPWSWLVTLWFLNIAIEIPYEMEFFLIGKYGKIIYRWAIFHGYVNVYQRVYAMGDYAIGRIPQKNMIFFLLHISHCVSHKMSMMILVFLIFVQHIKHTMNKYNLDVGDVYDTGYTPNVCWYFMNKYNLIFYRFYPYNVTPPSSVCCFINPTKTIVARCYT